MSQCCAKMLGAPSLYELIYGPTIKRHHKSQIELLIPEEQQIRSKMSKFADYNSDQPALVYTTIMHVQPHRQPTITHESKQYTSHNTKK